MIGNLEPEEMVLSPKPRTQTTTPLSRRNKMKFGFTPEAEVLNSRLAMLGFVAAVVSYSLTGQVIPGVW